MKGDFFLKISYEFDLALAFFGALIAVYILGPVSKDAFAYNQIFEHIKTADQIEYFFRTWLEFGAKHAWAFTATIFPLIFLSLYLKLRALNNLFPAKIYIFITYLATYYLLHDCTQIRISIALAFALWSCVAITRMQWVYALFLGLIALGFHITSILLPAAFFLCFISKTIRSSSWYFLLLGFLVYFFRVPIMEPVTIKLTNIMGGHYHSYTRVLVTNQNSSGLAFWYAQFLVCILIFARYFGTVNVDKLPRIYSLLLSVCVFGCGLIFWLYETVIIGSRLSDVLLILLVPLLGIMMTQLKFSSRVLFIVFLSLFFGARFFQLFVR